MDTTAKPIAAVMEEDRVKSWGCGLSLVCIANWLLVVRRYLCVPSTVAGHSHTDVMMPVMSLGCAVTKQLNNVTNLNVRHYSIGWCLDVSSGLGSLDAIHICT